VGVGVALSEKWTPSLSAFWREFWTGPPAAGIFALLGAGVAYMAARVAARAARKAALRQEWWDRASWALDLARSDDGASRVIGLRALEALEPDANEAESLMLFAVVDTVTGVADVDNSDQSSNNSDEEGDPGD